LKSLGETRCGVLPPAIDSEPGDNFNADRRKGKDVTPYLAYLTNTLADRGLGQSILYCPPRSFNNSGQQLFDLNELVSQTHGNLQGVWLCSMMNTKGQTLSSTTDAIKTIEVAGLKCVMIQELIGVKTKGGSYDLNSADFDFITANIPQNTYSYYINNSNSPKDEQDYLNALIINTSDSTKPYSQYDSYDFEID
jgi:hypothetical protein